MKKSRKFPDHCLICGKQVDMLSKSVDSKGYLPNPKGGTIEIDFGWGSRFDDGGNGIVHQAVICDNCYEKATQKGLTRAVKIEKTSKFSVLPENYSRSKPGELK